MSTSNYQQKFACGNKKCKGELIPIQILENKKEGVAKVLGKCPECKKMYEFSLSLNSTEVDKWLPIFHEQMFKCTDCNQPTLTTKKVVGNPRSEYKIKAECLECQKTNERFVDGGLFFLVEDKLPSAERTIIMCPTCGQKIVDESKKKCPKCGRDIFCSKCGSLLSPQAKFCARCAAPVQLGNVGKMSIPVVKTAVANVCPNCGASLSAGIKYCFECGQEVVCEKCGNHLPPGAIFCNVCGTAVKSGQKVTNSSKPLDISMGRVKR